MNEILIDLARSQDPQVFEDLNQIIQHDAKLEFLRHVRELQQLAHTAGRRNQNADSGCCCLPRAPYPRFHNTITISGERGSGKSTFLLNMIHLIRNEMAEELVRKDDTSRCTDDQRHNCLEILEIINPTRIGAKEDVFIHILSKIKECVDNRHSIRSRMKPHGADPDRRESWREPEQNNGAYRDWMDALCRVADGLPGLDSIGINYLQEKIWHDPVQVTEDGLRSMKAVNDLEKNFHTFIHLSLRLLEKDAFLIVFDDTDTVASASWPVLEVIRKYLTTPQCITILACDFSLCAELVAGQQHKNLKTSLSDLDDARKGDTLRMVEQTANQYLLKVLKPERRIFLQTLSECIGKNNFLVRHPDVDKGEPLADVLEQFCEKAFFLKQGCEKNKYIDHLLSLQVRTILQLLHCYVKNKQQEGIASILHSALFDAFLDDMQQVDFPANLLRKGQLSDPLNALTRSLAEQNLLYQGFRLWPDLADRQANSRMIVLGACYAELMRKAPALYFDYFVKVGLIREVARLMFNRKSGDIKKDLNDYLQYTGLNRAAQAPEIARFNAGFVFALFQARSEDAKTCRLGLVILQSHGEGKRDATLDTKEGKKGLLSHFRLSDPAKIDLAFSRYPKQFAAAARKVKSEHNRQKNFLYFNHIDSLLTGITSWHSAFVSLPADIARDKGDQRIPIVSFYSLLAAIGELVHEGHRDWMRNPDDGGRERRLIHCVQRLSQMVTYDLPEWGMGDHEAIEKEISFTPEPEEKMTRKDGEDDFYKLLVQWCGSGSKMSDGMPVNVLGGISSRFFANLEEIDYCRDDGLYLGHLLYRYIIAFLNAVLVEEQLHRGGQDILLENPIHTDHIFLHNLKIVCSSASIPLQKKQLPSTDKDRKIFKELSMTSPFFSWICACPLWLLYLDPEQKELFAFMQLIAGLDNPAILKVSYHREKDIFANLFVPMNSVLLQRPATWGEIKTFVHSGDEEKFVRQCIFSPGGELQKFRNVSFGNNDTQALEREIFRKFFHEKVGGEDVPTNQENFTNNLRRIFVEQWRQWTAQIEDFISQCVFQPDSKLQQIRDAAHKNNDLEELKKEIFRKVLTEKLGEEKTPPYSDKIRDRVEKLIDEQWKEWLAQNSNPSESA